MLTNLKSKYLVITILALILMLGAVIFKPSFISNLSEQAAPTIVVGEGNPGRISFYARGNKGDYARIKDVDTGSRFVWTVRVGDFENEGKNKVYAGIGNSFYDSKLSCKVIKVDPSKDYQITVIDEIEDLRCKDLTIGDVDNDGTQNLVVGNHGAGIIKVYSYKDGTYQKEEVEKNYLAEYDAQNKTDHKVAGLPSGWTVQTAVHVVSVGDIDNDGKNEMIATVSDPLEYPNKDHQLFLRVYRFTGGQWQMENIDQLTEAIPFKAAVRIVDIDNDGKNEVLLGASHHNLILYRFENDKWQKQIIDKEEGGVEDNMKGIEVAQLTRDVSNSIVLATGVTRAAVYNYVFENGSFNKKQLANISELIAPYKLFKGIADNSLEVKTWDFDGDGNLEIVVTGLQDSSALADKEKVTKFGFEATSLGFTAVLINNNGNYETNLLDFRSGLALDVGNL